MNILVLNELGKLCKCAVLRRVLLGHILRRKQTLHRNEPEKQNDEESPDGRSDETRKYPRAVFSGILPTGQMHLGNYLGVLRKCKEMQNEKQTMRFCIMDLQSITMPQQPTVLREKIIKTAATMIACGIERERSTIFVQSAVYEHCVLGWILGCLTNMTLLGNVPQSMEDTDSLDGIPFSIYSSRVMQAADMLLYKATHVAVGENKIQHVELAQHLAAIFNKRFGSTFPIPQTIVGEEYASRILSLGDPSRKMSKSDDDPEATVFLHDEPEVIVEKFKKATTDHEFDLTYDPDEHPGASNLIAIHHLVTGTPMEAIVAEAAALDADEYKLRLADAVVEHLTPIRSRIQAQLEKRNELIDILEAGALQARETAQATMVEVKRKIGLHEERKFPVTAAAMNRLAKRKNPQIVKYSVPPSAYRTESSHFNNANPFRFSARNVKQKVCRFDDLMSVEGIKLNAINFRDLAKKATNTKGGPGLETEAVKLTAAAATGSDKNEMTKAEAETVTETTQMRINVSDDIANERENVAPGSVENKKVEEEENRIVDNAKEESSNGTPKAYIRRACGSAVNDLNNTATGGTQRTFVTLERHVTYAAEHAIVDDKTANAEEIACVGHVKKSPAVDYFEDVGANITQNAAINHYKETTYTEEDVVEDNVQDETTNEKQDSIVEEESVANYFGGVAVQYAAIRNAKAINHNKETTYTDEDNVVDNVEVEATNEEHDSEVVEESVVKVESVVNYFGGVATKNAAKRRTKSINHDKDEDAGVDHFEDKTTNEKQGSMVEEESVANYFGGLAAQYAAIRNAKPINHDTETVYTEEDNAVDNVEVEATNEEHDSEVVEESVFKVESVVNDFGAVATKNAANRRTKAISYDKETTNTEEDAVVDYVEDEATNEKQNLERKEDSAIEEESVAMPNAAIRRTKAVNHDKETTCTEEQAVVVADEAKNEKQDSEAKEDSVVEEESVVNYFGGVATKFTQNAAMHRVKERTYAEKYPLLKNFKDANEDQELSNVGDKAPNVEQQPKLVNKDKKTTYSAEVTVVNNVKDGATNNTPNSHKGHVQKDSAMSYGKGQATNMKQARLLMYDRKKMSTIYNAQLDSSKQFPKAGVDYMQADSKLNLHKHLANSYEYQMMGNVKHAEITAKKNAFYQQAKIIIDAKKGAPVTKNKHDMSEKLRNLMRQGKDLGKVSEQNKKDGTYYEADLKGRRKGY